MERRLYFAVLLLVAGCGGGAAAVVDPVPAPAVDPATVRVTAPALPAFVSRGGAIDITYVDDDPDGLAATTLYADRDGDLTTTADQFVIEADRPELDGAVQTIRWDTTSIPLGRYSVLARMTDPDADPFTGSAAGSVTIENVAFALNTGDGWGEDVDVSTDGSQFVTGVLNGDTIFGKGEANETIVIGDGAFVARYNPDGTLAWVRQVAGELQGHGIATFADSSCCAVGTFREAPVFGAGEPSETTLVATNPGFDAVWIAHYHPDGALAWARGIVGDQVAAHQVAAFPDGDVVVVGQHQGTVVLAAGEPEETTLTAAGGTSRSDLFVARYDPEGRLEWVRRAGAELHDIGLGITSFADGTCAVVGYFTNTVTFGEGEPNERTLTSAGAEDVFVMRVEAGGALRWVRRIGGVTNEYRAGVAAREDGSCYVCAQPGISSYAVSAGEPDEVTFVATRPEALVALYLADGSLAWARSTEDADGTGYTRAQAIAASSGACFVTGSIRGTVTFGAGESRETTLAVGDGTSVFVARYAADGSLAWARAAPALNAQSLGIDAFPDGSCIATGLFLLGTLTFAAGEPGEVTLMPVGPDSDFFLARFNADGDF